MRGSVRKRGPSWIIVLDVGRETDPTTGRARRRQKIVSVRGTKKDAEKKLNDLIKDVNGATYVEPSKLTVKDWLNEWMGKAIEGRKTPATVNGYRRILDKHILPALGETRLQALKGIDLEAYYASRSLSGATVQVHHTILNSALKAAVRAKLVPRNVAEDVTNKPRKPAGQPDVLDHVWTAEEAGRFLKTARAAGPQPAAFYALALDTGARRGELASLKWSDLDTNTGRLMVQRHLVQGGREPVFGPTKTKTARTIELAQPTLTLLAAHKKHQAEIKLKNRRKYHDLGLMFAKEWGDLHGRAESLGLPLQVNTIGEREFHRLIGLAGVRRIKFHGMRHTVATLMLSAGVPAHVVQRRLGHSKVEMTLGIYAHALPSMQQDAAAKLAALLHG